MARGGRLPSRQDGSLRAARRAVPQLGDGERRSRGRAAPAASRPSPGAITCFLAPNCPWAHRTQIFRRLKRLEDVISISLAHLPRKRSWLRARRASSAIRLGVFELHLSAYISRRVPNFTGRVTVPTLWDKKNGTIVNNELSQIIRMLNCASTPGASLGRLSIPPICGPRSTRSTSGSTRRSTTAFTGAASQSRSTPMRRRSAAVRDAGLARGLLRAALPLRRAHHRSRLASVHHARALRPAYYYGNFKCNRQLHLRISQSVELSARALSVAGASPRVTDIDIKRDYYAIRGTLNPTGIVPSGRKLRCDAGSGMSAILVDSYVLPKNGLPLTPIHRHSRPTQ